MNLSQHVKGRGFIELILGCMFAGKSTEAMRLARLRQIAGWTCLCIKYAEDTRYDADAITSHDQVKMSAVTGTDLALLDALVIDDFGKRLCDCVVIDETQMFNEETTFGVVLRWKAHGVYVICAGLDLSASREWYPNMLKLSTRKDAVKYLHAFCMECKEAEACFTWSASNPTGALVVGGLGMYTPVCSKCYEALSNKNCERK